MTGTGTKKAAGVVWSLQGLKAHTINITPQAINETGPNNMKRPRGNPKAGQPMWDGFAKEYVEAQMFKCTKFPAKYAEFSGQWEHGHADFIDFDADCNEFVFTVDYAEAIKKMSKLDECGTMAAKLLDSTEQDVVDLNYLDAPGSSYTNETVQLAEFLFQNPTGYKFRTYLQQGNRKAQPVVLDEDTTDKLQVFVELANAARRA